MALSVFMFGACQHKQPEKSVVSIEAQHLFEQRDSDPLYLVKEGFRRHNANTYAKTSKELMSILQTAQIPSSGKGFILFDVSCYALMDPEKEAPASSCSYYTKSRDQKKRAKKSFTGPSAEALRMLLSGFPVNQGDSGVSVGYIHCEQTNADFPSCDLSVELNYAGP